MGTQKQRGEGEGEGEREGKRQARRIGVERLEGVSGLIGRAGERERL
jgi:hypothetical protein